MILTESITEAESDIIISYDLPPLSCIPKKGISVNTVICVNEGMVFILKLGGITR